MSIENELRARAENACELCGASENLAVIGVPPHDVENAETSLLACAKCCAQIAQSEPMDVHHWRCLGESMWTPTPAVQVMAWRLLNQLRGEAWALDLLETLYLDDETRTWAERGVQTVDAEGEVLVHRDSNGAQLAAGDSVTLIKDLKVKGAGFTAKRGTAVRNISLVADNPEHIEGRVEGQQIVILTEFVKKNA